jgi:hypothetical protein
MWPRYAYIKKLKQYNTVKWKNRRSYNGYILLLLNRDMGPAFCGFSQILRGWETYGKETRCLYAIHF